MMQVAVSPNCKQYFMCRALIHISGIVADGPPTGLVKTQGRLLAAKATSVLATVTRAADSGCRKIVN